MKVINYQLGGFSICCFSPVFPSRVYRIRFGFGVFRYTWCRWPFLYTTVIPLGLYCLFFQWIERCGIKFPNILLVLHVQWRLNSEHDHALTHYIGWNAVWITNLDTSWQCKMNLIPFSSVCVFLLVFCRPFWYKSENKNRKQTKKASEARLIM